MFKKEIVVFYPSFENGGATKNLINIINFLLFIDVVFSFWLLIKFFYYLLFIIYWINFIIKNIVKILPF